MDRGLSKITNFMICRRRWQRVPPTIPTNTLPGHPRISGMARVNHEFFRWICGVGIDGEDIFAPVQDLKSILLWFVSIGTVLVALLTYSIARRITVPLNELTRSARIVADGDLNQRVEVSGQDEVGNLAKTFNEMAQSLQERSQALLELNRKLEEKVDERTRELKESGEEVQASLPGAEGNAGAAGTEREDGIAGSVGCRHCARNQEPLELHLWEHRFLEEIRRKAERFDRFLRRTA